MGRRKVSSSDNFDLQSVKEIATSLLKQAGKQVSDLVVFPGSTGGNNRVAVLEASNQKYLFKNYYVSRNDARDRLSHEWDFLCYAEKMKINCVPRPVTCNKEMNVGIYEFIQGGKLSQDELSNNHVHDAINFVQLLNKPERFETGAKLAQASEACFNIKSHIEMVQNRVERLQQIHTHEKFQVRLVQLVNDININFEKIQNSILNSCHSQCIDICQDIDPEERCISPSDFGFHNALLVNGNIVFLDFEYAGWDDPAKLIADFFCQPEVPVPENLFDIFSDGCLRYLENNDNKYKHKKRATMLLPLYRLKWCCIMLNEFLPNSWERRNFAKNMKPQHYLMQIDKVERSLSDMKIN